MNKRDWSAVYDDSKFDLSNKKSFLSGSSLGINSITCLMEPKYRTIMTYDDNGIPKISAEMKKNNGQFASYQITAIAGIKQHNHDDLINISD